jgi:enoyl-CoA hydratase/carnithine racemase
VSEAVTYERRGGIVWVTINRPDSRNALSAEVRTGLWEATRRFNADEAGRVLVLTGSGDKAFCAGGDLKEMASAALEVPGPDFVPHFGRNIDVPKPTIAAVNGAAVAGGFLLAMMCDLCVAADHARFAITEARVGRGAPWAALLPELIGRRAALELLLTGRPMDAARGHQLGLVNDVVTPAGLVDAAQALGEAIAANAPLSVAASKRMLSEVRGMAGPAAYDRADEIWEPVYRSRDAKEGPRAFGEKRPPRWEGR